jgi:DNA-directed RNA polymerase subunit K/omega
MDEGEDYFGDDDYDGSEEDDFDFEEEEEEPIEGEPEPEEEEEKELGKIEEEYPSEAEEDDDLTDFQKMLTLKQKQDTRTSNRLSKYELAAIIGFRAQQIAEGAPPYIDVGSLTDPSAMAAKELDEGLIPFTLERPLPSNKIGKFTYEIRQLDELINVNHLI